MEYFGVPINTLQISMVYFGVPINILQISIKYIGVPINILKISVKGSSHGLNERVQNARECGSCDPLN